MTARPTPAEKPAKQVTPETLTKSLLRRTRRYENPKPKGNY